MKREEMIQRRDSEEGRKERRKVERLRRER